MGGFPPLKENPFSQNNSLSNRDQGNKTSTKSKVKISLERDLCVLEQGRCRGMKQVEGGVGLSGNLLQFSTTVNRPSHPRRPSCGPDSDSEIACTTPSYTDFIHTFSLAQLYHGQSRSSLLNESFFSLYNILRLLYINPQNSRTSYLLIFNRLKKIIIKNRSYQFDCVFFKMYVTRLKQGFPVQVTFL